jgi:phasin family protein
MFGQFSKQMENSSQPASELVAANVNAMEAVTKQQTLFFSGLVDDSVKLMQTIAQQTEMKDILAAQAVYAESLRERLTSTSANTYNTISSVSQKYTDAFKSGYETASEVAKETVKTAPVAKAAPVTKPAPGAKSTPVIKPTPVVRAASIVEAAPAGKKAPAVRADKEQEAELIKTATKIKQTPKEIAKEVTKGEAKKPVAKSKPVTTLSADEVKTSATTKADDVKTVSDIKSAPVTKA